MKVTVQNGANHWLTRKEAEIIIGLLPNFLSEKVNSIVLYKGSEPEISVRFYPKLKTLGLFCPTSEKPVACNKAQAIGEFLIALASISEKGYFSKNMSISIRNKYMADTAELKEKCLESISYRNVNYE